MSRNARRSIRYLTVDEDGTVNVTNGLAPDELQDAFINISQLAPSVIVERVGTVKGHNPVAACLRGQTAREDTVACNVYRVEDVTDPVASDMSDADIEAIRVTIDRFYVARTIIGEVCRTMFGGGIYPTERTAIDTAIMTIHQRSGVSPEKWGTERIRGVADALNHFRLDDGTVPSELVDVLVPGDVRAMALRAMSPRLISTTELNEHLDRIFAKK